MKNVIFAICVLLIGFFATANSQTAAQTKIMKASEQTIMLLSVLDDSENMIKKVIRGISKPVTPTTVKTPKFKRAIAQLKGLRLIREEAISKLKKEKERVVKIPNSEMDDADRAMCKVLIISISEAMKLYASDENVANIKKIVYFGEKLLGPITPEKPKFGKRPKTPSSVPAPLPAVSTSNIKIS